MDIIENKLALKSAADSGVAKNADPNKRTKSPNKKIAATKAAMRFIFFIRIPHKVIMWWHFAAWKDFWQPTEIFVIAVSWPSIVK